MPEIVRQAPAAADWWLLGAAGLLTIVSIVLALAETSLTRMTPTRARDLLRERRSRSARALDGLLRRHAAALNLVLLLAAVAQVTWTVLLYVVFSRWLVAWVAVVVVIAATSVITFVVTGVAPKTYAVQQTDRAALQTAPVVAFLLRLPLLGAVTRLLIGVGNVLTPGRGLTAGPFAPSEDEIMASIDEATEGGEIEAEEREMLHSVLEFGDTVVRAVMVPRTDMAALEVRQTISDALQIILRTGYSRIPVYDGGPDNVVGLAYAKDVLRLLNEGRTDQPLAELLRRPPFMPESMRAADALREMRRRASHMAIVIDEYGGTAGLVTIEDLLEEIVGEIADEYDREEPRVEPLPDGGFRVNARLPIDEVNELLGAELPATEWDTIGGLLFNLVGEVPAEGQEVDVQGLRLRAERVQGRRVGVVRIQPLAQPAGEGDEGDPEDARPAARRSERASGSHPQS
jgi:CBS domain containing-hemolysin-like protein